MRDTQRKQKRLKHHYVVEKALADRLRSASTREERAVLYNTMYDELFAEVPDHPRLVSQKSRETIDAINDKKMRVIDRFLGPAQRVAEVGAGDCTFAFRLCERVHEVVALDITAESATFTTSPNNFELVVYDGFNLPADFDPVDLVFSDQLVEHLHPDDAEWHFGMILDALAPGGVYVFRTPHRVTGPHDISGYFTSGEPEGFHLKEWTFRELRSVLQRVGYRRVCGYWSARGRSVRLPMVVLAAVESVLAALPRPARARLGRLLVPTILVSAHK